MLVFWKLKILTNEFLFQLAFLKAPGVKNVTLLHAIAQTVQEKFPELAGFSQELKFIEKASTSKWNIPFFCLNFTRWLFLFSLVRISFVGFG